MKKLSLTLTMLVAITMSVFAQDAFEGKITYAITYENVPAEMAQYKAMLPSESVQYVQKNKMRQEQGSAASSTITITDTKKNESIMMMDMMGKKIRINISGDDFEEAQEDYALSNMEKTEETKEIAGYTCKLAYVSVGEGAEQIDLDVWYTDELKVEAQTQFEELGGFPMAYSMDVPGAGFTMVLTVSGVEEQKVDKSMFEASKEYELFTIEELKQLTGQ